MEVKQEFCEMYKHDIKTEAGLIFGQTEEYNALSTKSDVKNELGDQVSIIESQVTGQFTSVDEFKQDIEYQVPQIEQRLDFPLKIDPDLVTKQVQIFPMTTVKQELKNATKVRPADIVDIKQDICEYVQFKNESELLTSHFDLPTLKSENNDNPDYLIPSCSNTEDMSKNCIDSQTNYSSSQLGSIQIYEGQYKKHVCCKKSSGKQFKCDIFFKEFNIEQNLRRHLIVHSNKKPFKWDICLTEFKRKGCLQRHLISHTNKKSFKCDICFTEFNHQRSLIDHSIIHTIKKPFKCEICYKEFHYQFGLTKHVKIHSNERQFMCEICSKVFTHKFNLDKHLIIHSNERPFKCDICFKRFNHNNVLQDHLMSHTNKTPFKCAICSQEFNMELKLKLHLIIHNNGQSFKCDICSKTFKRKAALQTHLKIHTDLKPFKCDICLDRFHIKSQLREHLIIHSNLFTCDICFKEFNEKVKLDKHLINHTNDLPFKCDICFRKFKNKAALINHLKIHTKPFKCDICSNRFRAKSHLREHLTIHLFTCTICFKKFDQESTLQSHLLTHNDRKVFIVKSKPVKYVAPTGNGLTNANSSYTNEEYFQIVVWHNTGYSIPQIISMFQQMFPNKLQPTQAIIERTMENLCAHGSFSGTNGRNEPVVIVPCMPLNPDHELRDIMICAAVEQDSTRTTRDLAREFGVSHMKINKILKANGYRSFKLHRADEMFPDDQYFRMEFCERMMEMANADENFIRNILFTDESSFPIHNLSISWNFTKENQQRTYDARTQKLNVWTGILGDNIVGPFFIDGILNAQSYLQLLQNDIIPAVRALDVPFHSIWFQQDECPAHNSILVKEYISELFPGRLIVGFPSMDGHIPWPARSPDLAPCNFFLRGYTKSKLYGFQEERARNLDELRIRICNTLRGISPAMLSNVRENFYNRLGYCSSYGGGRFEYLL
ncbi:unnamed protein product [Psylliodes chrysocephalus]|uniref:C2H2-type domain-containing protein n=1 Tax=Psylliodes chrysocephalus TaxID=3402493 RepID=A0A9P0D9K4_9CUCU|nr:unnamed protein product [Psylliodes chrysocephala]